MQYIFAHLSDERSRNLGNIRNDLIQEIVMKQTPKEMDVQITLVVDRQEQVYPAAWCGFSFLSIRAVSTHIGLQRGRESVPHVQPKDILYQAEATHRHGRLCRAWWRH